MTQTEQSFHQKDMSSLVAVVTDNTFPFACLAPSNRAATNPSLMVCLSTMVLTGNFAT